MASRKVSSLAGPTAVIVAAVVGCSLYANAAFLVRDPADYRYFPPFERRNNQNHVQHLGAEYYSIAGAIAKGRGFADPFRAPTGPTAWMPPVFSWLLGGLRWATADDRGAVAAVIVVLQDVALIATGLLVVALARLTTGRVWLATVVYLATLVYYFRQAFQFTHDCWIVLAGLDATIAGLVWWRPLERAWRAAAGWGIVGGLCALVSPSIGFVWGVFATVDGLRRRRRTGFATAVVAATLTVSPWVVRNYVAFGRFVPVKSNLGFELYQSQCVQEGGVLHDPIFQVHPNGGDNAERREYARLGEMAYVDHKSEQFRASVRSDPGDFLERLGNRFLEATLVYVPFNTADESRRPWRVWFARLIYPLPFVCLVGLTVTAWRRLGRAERIVIGAFVAYLLPYVVVSYYDRYKVPVLGAEALLLVWGIERFLIGSSQSHGSRKGW